VDTDDNHLPDEEGITRWDVTEEVLHCLNKIASMAALVKGSPRRLLWIMLIFIFWM
jgi:hypothetical protein